MRRILLLATATAVLLGAAPAAFACDARQTSRAVKHKPRTERAPLILGDSTMIFAAPMLGRRGLEADAQGCRQFSAGVSILAQRKRAGRLPRVAILALGANGTIGRGAVARAARVMGRNRILGLVTPRQASSSAAAMRWAARRWPDRVLLIDWVRHSAAHGGWFGGDGLHVNHTGARAFANLVERAVDPLVHPPLRVLRLPRRPEDAAAICGRRVVVVRGADRTTCARARAVARKPRMRPIPGWRFYDLRGARRPAWEGAYVRRGGKVVVATTARRVEPPAPPPPPTEEPAPAPPPPPPAARAAATARPRILATGDSMMLLTDRELRAALAPTGRAVVRDDVRPATGLTKPHLLDWVRHARRQARRYRPDVVVVTMGANEGFPLGTARCCGARWRTAYEARIERVSRAWRRGGVERVYWLTLPEPIPSVLSARFAGVNAAVSRARGIAVVDTRPILTPDGVFLQELETAPGRVEKIRSDDGVHLWWPGARLVAAAVVERLEDDGILRRPA